MSLVAEIGNNMFHYDMQWIYGNFNYIQIILSFSFVSAATEQCIQRPSVCNYYVYKPINRLINYIYGT